MKSTNNFKSTILSLFITCIVVMAVIPAWSQSEKSFLDKFSIGFRGGVNFPTMVYTNPDLAKYQSSLIISPAFGAFAEIDLSKHISIRPEVMYIGKGQTIDENDFLYEFNSQYYDCRLPIILNFGKPQGVRPYLMVAPVFGLAVGGTIKLDDGFDKWQIKITNASINDYELSVLAGAGIKIPIKLGKLTLLAGVEAAFGLGLTDTYSLSENNGSSEGLNWEDYKIKGTRTNRGWQASASIAIPFSNFKRKVVKKEPQKSLFAVEKEKSMIDEKPGEIIKECYTIEEINTLIDEQKSVNNKKICMNNLNFEFNKSTLDQVSKSYLEGIVTLLYKIELMKMKIKGHTDNVGTEEYNSNLSKKRAKAVCDYLNSKGISSSRITYEYYGSSRPLESNDTEENRAKNRRVEFEIIQK